MMKAFACSQSGIKPFPASITWLCVGLRNAGSPIFGAEPRARGDGIGEQEGEVKDAALLGTSACCHGSVRHKRVGRREGLLRESAARQPAPPASSL